MEKAWIKCNAKDCGHLQVNGRCALSEIRIDVKTGACLSMDPEKKERRRDETDL